jgi:hemerythrin-like domain-containing protein
MSPVSTLLAEHNLIKRLLTALHAYTQNLRQNQEVNVTLVERIKEFGELFIDKIHHKKEEDIFFRAFLVKELPSPLQEKIDQMIIEHAYIRDELKNVHQALIEFKVDININAIIASLEKFTHFIEQHLILEEKQLFPQMHNYLDESEEAQMEQEFAEIDQKLAYAKYENLINDIEAKLKNNG